MADPELVPEAIHEQDGLKVSKSPWGADDEIGRLNWITPETNAAILGHLDGRHVFDLNVEYFIGMPSWVAAGDPGADELLRVRERLAGWDKPALVCFGHADQVFTVDVAREVAALIPTAGEPEMVTGAAHFLPEDRGGFLAERIRRFLTETR